MKAVILINSIPATITATKSFRLLTNQVYQSIQYACDSNPSVYHDNYIRHFTLLLQLPHLKMLSSKLIRLFIDMRTNDLLPQADLLLEMLDAQETFDSTSTFLTHPTENITSNSSTPLTNNNSTTPKNFNQQEDMKTSNLDTTNSKISFRVIPSIINVFLDPNNYPVISSSPLVYSSPSGKHSPVTPPLQFYNHSRTDSSAPSTNLSFTMNNSSY